MDNFSTISEYLFVQSLQIVGVFGGVLLLSFLLRRASSHVRYLLWLLVIAKCVFPTVMKVSLAVLPEREVAAIVTAVEPAVMPVAYEEPVIVSTSSKLEYFDDAAVFSSSSIFDQLGEITPFQWAGIVWVFGVVLFFVVVCFRALQLNRKLHRLRRIAELDCSLDGRDDISVWQIDGIGQPFVWGLFRGSVYVPGNFNECGSVSDRQGIMMHEFAHVRRFDAGVNLLQIFAQGLFWFHPLVWIANTMVRREREKCCDEAAIANLKSPPRDYGNAIIGTLAREYESNMRVPSLAVAGPVKNIEDRLKTIMRPGKKFYKRCGVFALITIVLLAIVALPVGCILTTRDVAVEEQETVVEDVVMLERVYEVPVLKSIQPEAPKDRESYLGKVAMNNASQIVHHIKKNIFPSGETVGKNKSSIFTSNINVTSNSTTTKDTNLINSEIWAFEITVVHVPSVHEKIEAYVENLRKEFYSEHGFAKAESESEKKADEKAKKTVAAEKGEVLGGGEEVSGDDVLDVGDVKEDMSILVDCKLISVDEDFLDKLKAKKTDVFNDSDVIELLNEKTEILASPRILIRDGKQGSLEIEDLLAHVDGKENYTFAVNLSVDGKIQDDNETVMLKIDSQFRAKEPDDETKKGDMLSNEVTTKVLVPNNGTVLFGGGLNIMPGKRILLLVKPSIIKDKPVVEQKDQVSIETRFVVVNSNFLKDIGLAAKNIWLTADDVDADNIKEPYSMPKVSYEFLEGDKPMDNKKSAALLSRMGISDANNIAVGYLNYEKTDFFLRAAQAHSDSRTLTAPKLILVDGEPGSISVTKDNSYIAGYDEVGGDKGKSSERVIESVVTGINVILTPHILKNDGSVDIELKCMSDDLFSLQQYKHESGKMYDVPNLVKSQMRTRMSIPEGKTLMIAALKTVNKITKTNKKGESAHFEPSDLIVLIKPTVIEVSKPVDEAILVK